MTTEKNNALIPEVYAARTDVGCVREHNEDSFVAQAPLFAVADGMGGHESGEVASEIAISTLLEKAPDHPDGDALVNAVKAANTAVIRGVQEGVGRPGMGTTVTCAQIFDDQLLIAQVGDSRAYLLHDGRLQRITRDHSLVMDLVEQGRLTEEEARFHPQRSVITRALGSDVTVEPDLYILRISEGDRVLLCSDGLSGMVEDCIIEHILATVDDATKCCGDLVQEALAAGGSDNVTVVVIDPFKRLPKEPRRPKHGDRAKKHIAPIIWAVALVVILVGCCSGVFAYAKHSYYVIDEGGYVCIYQGLPGKAGPVKLSWLVERTEVPTANLPESTAERLVEGEAVESLESAYALVGSYAEVDADTVPAQAPAAE